MDSRSVMWPRFENNVQNDTATTPVYPQAIIYSVLSFPAWILCITPMIWHFSKHNIAAGSLILWIALNNFFNSINPILWPRDNLDEWWEGKIWCDINVRIQIGATVGVAASTAMIVRKLAKVMDTRNITISEGNSKLKESIWEILWCWIYPSVMIAVYYVVQPARYLLFGIIGCISAFHTSWPSLALNFMWAPITMLVAAFYATLLIYRLHCYRREFHRLITGSNTTKSRFIRLFVICAFVILIYLPTSLWMLFSRWVVSKDHYDWNDVHGPNFHKIIKVPASGQISIEKWGQAATGYIVFFVFGTSTDSHIMQKEMLLKLGLGKYFPSLSVMRQNDSSMLRRLTAARTWSFNMSSKAKSIFQSKVSLTSSSFNSSTLRNSTKLDLSTTTPTVMAEDTTPTLNPHNIQQDLSLMSPPSFLKRVFRRANHRSPILPLFSRRAPTESADTDQPMTQSITPGVHPHIWASERTISEQTSEISGVRVIREVRQDHHAREQVNYPQSFWHPWI